MLHFSRWLMQPVQFEIHRSVHHESVNHRGHTRSFYWITKTYTTLETSHTDNFVYFIAAVVNDKNSDICVEPWVSKPRLMNRFSPIRDLKFSARWMKIILVFWMSTPCWLVSTNVSDESNPWRLTLRAVSRGSCKRLGAVFKDSYENCILKVRDTTLLRCDANILPVDTMSLRRIL